MVGPHRRPAVFTPEYGYHLLVLGLITWGSAQFASYATFGHRRPINAVVVIGLLLLANMSLTIRRGFSSSSRSPACSCWSASTLDEQADWLRRRIGDPTAISALYLRGGTVFIIAAIAGSLVLTTAAASAPLAGAWTDAGARVVEWGQFLERFLPASRGGRSLGPSFGDTSVIQSVWSSSPRNNCGSRSGSTRTSPRPSLPPCTTTSSSCAAGRRSPGVQAVKDAGTDVLAGTAEDVDAEGRTSLTVTIQPAFSRREIFTPGPPTSISAAARLHLTAEGGYLTGIDRDPSEEAYDVTALVPGAEAQGGLGAVAGGR